MRHVMQTSVQKKHVYSGYNLLNVTEVHLLKSLHLCLVGTALLIICDHDLIVLKKSWRSWNTLKNILVFVVAQKLTFGLNLNQNICRLILYCKPLSLDSY